MALDGLWVPAKATWYSAFQEELLTFPVGRHDDIVDALGLVGQLVALPGLRPPSAKKDKADSGYPTFSSPTEMEAWADNSEEGHLAWAQAQAPDGFIDEDFHSIKTL